MHLRHALVTCSLVFAALLAPAQALASRGNYVFDGGTPSEQAQVRAALDASAFDWNLVHQQITVHIARGIPSEATKGEIWLDSDLLDAGQFSWGTVQHEYAHQVDFFLLDGEDRATLSPLLAAPTWWADGIHRHAEIGCERFASTLAWAYWPSHANALRPTSRRDEAGALPPAQFRALLSRLLGVPATHILALHR